jgi:hypothetical protein
MNAKYFILIYGNFDSKKQIYYKVQLFQIIWTLMVSDDYSFKGWGACNMFMESFQQKLLLVMKEDHKFNQQQ